MSIKTKLLSYPANLPQLLAGSVASTTVYFFFRVNEFMLKHGKNLFNVSEINTYSSYIKNPRGSFKHVFRVVPLLNMSLMNLIC